jgi:hypothetical protein
VSRRATVARYVLTQPGQASYNGLLTGNSVQLGRLVDDVLAAAIVVKRVDGVGWAPQAMGVRRPASTPSEWSRWRGPGSQARTASMTSRSGRRPRHAACRSRRS